MAEPRPFKMALVLLACFNLPVLLLAQVHDTPPGQKNELAPLALSIRVAPGFEIPLGEYAEYYRLGGCFGVHSDLRHTRLPFFATARLNYSYAPIQAQKSISMLSGQAGAGAFLDVGSRFSCNAQATGGYYYGLMNGGGSSGGQFCWAAGAGVDFLVNPLIDLTLAAEYRNYLGLYAGVSATMGTCFNLGDTASRKKRIESSRPVRPQLLQGFLAPEPGRGVQFRSVELTEVFPIFYKYYDDHPIGRAILQNVEKEPIGQVKLELFIKQYMDSPKVCLAVPELAAGQSVEVELYSLFTEKALEVTEGTKTSAELALEYRRAGNMYKEVRIETVRLLDRNAMTWDDDRRASAFVTAKDPVVLSFSKNIAGLVREKGSRVINGTLQTGIGVHEALRLYGLTYTVDPKTPFVEFSKSKNQVDYLQFPRQTLEYRAGDCDDLSILYAALLESVGIETAFITVPGHILIAFALDMSPDEAAGSFSQQNQLIYRDSQVWVPVEVTERTGGFLQAWEKGASSWRQYEPSQKASFYPVHEAWKLYEPVGLPGSAAELSLPSRDSVLAAYLQEVMRFIDREIYPQEQKLKADVQKTKGEAKARNRLGVLYGRYGLWDKAVAEFSAILKRQDYTPALINMANVYFLQEDWMNALSFYERAKQKEPRNDTILLGLAKVHHELENYTMAKLAFEQLKQQNAALAEQVAYLELRGEEAVRASQQSSAKGRTIWQE